MKLKDKVVIVTGASSGMGRAISYLFAKEGATVYAVARREEKLLELKEEVKDFAGKVIPMVVDLMQQSASEKLVDDVIAEAKKLDILVNNAGMMDDFSPIADVSDEMFERVFALNVYAPMYTMRKAVKYFLEVEGGNIINIASIGGLYGSRAGAVYTASKHALIGLTKNTAYMYANKNIRTNAICPGGVDTEIGAGEFMKHINSTGMDRIALGMGNNPRSGSSEEIAAIALFLASADSSFVNGQAIVADSGWTAY